MSSRGQKKQFFADSGPKHAILRAIGKPIREQPAKTSVSHFRDREKPSVLTASDQNRRFFASRTPPTANPILNKQRSRHQSRRWRASSPGSRTPITGTGFYHHRDWSGVTIPEYCRILNAYLRHYNERRPKGKLTEPDAAPQEPGAGRAQRDTAGAWGRPRPMRCRRSLGLAA